MELARVGGEPGLSLPCSLVIDLRTDDTVHWLRVEGMVPEHYDVLALSGVCRPMAFGFKTEEIRRTIAVGNQGQL
jgi:hypothetical protein